MAPSSMLDSRREFSRKKMTRKVNEKSEDGIATDIMVADTGGVRNSTITKRAWYIFENTNQKHMIKAYGSKNEGQLRLIVNAVTKVWVTGREETIIFVLNCATLIKDEEEAELLLVPFELMQHGIKEDLTLPNLGG
eukprot:5125252-Ditylum_brightwellii.AAC.1